jgi:hypothetical protein
VYQHMCACVHQVMLFVVGVCMLLYVFCLPFMTHDGSLALLVRVWLRVVLSRRVHDIVIACCFDFQSYWLLLLPLVVGSLRPHSLLWMVYHHAPRLLGHSFHVVAAIELLSYRCL